MAHVQTVLGPVATSELGGIMHHEHLLSLTPGPWLSGGPPARARSDAPTPDGADMRARDEAQVEVAVAALGGLAELGIGTVVDLSPYGVVGRDTHGGNVALLQEISRRSGVHVVAGTAVYLEPYSPDWAIEATLDEMAERFVADVIDGIGDTTVKAGILGEQATGLGVITAHEEKCLRAAARAQRETGLALITHTTHGTMALEQVEILAEEGADLSRVVIGHMDTQADAGYDRAVLDTGVNIAFDTIGKQFWDFVVEPLPDDLPEGEFTKQAYFRSDHSRARRIAALVADGYRDRLLLAQDMTGVEVYLNSTTHGEWGYSYLGAAFADLLRQHGVTDADMTTMLQHNPARLLTQMSG
ncbi:phosphotriesterase family protein [Phytoactinopolyspora limicola]|uniref:phosphotriesterase family protein n=1 Tax=Phytoactinopolyspora limicola TaxID=2715536 RepID=UPI001407B8BC|nr:aryldialkylphosphatase [Phytoactinopolyspora limicola]